MKLAWLRDFIIRTVWPYLSPQAGGSAASTASSAASSASTASPSPPSRVTQQVLFSTIPYGPNIVGRLDDAVSTLTNASLLWKSRGDEVIRSFCCAKFSSDTATWVIELLISPGSIRSTASPFSPPILITLDSTHSEVEVNPNVQLPANAGLYARVVSGPPPADGFSDRLDGILEIERNARLP